MRVGSKPNICNNLYLYIIYPSQVLWFDQLGSSVTILSSSARWGQVLSRSRDGISGELLHGKLELHHSAVITHPPSQFVPSSSSELQQNLHFSSQGKLISSCSLWGVSVAFGICDGFAFDMKTDLSCGRANACWAARNWNLGKSQFLQALWAVKGRHIPSLWVHCGFVCPTKLRVQAVLFLPILTGSTSHPTREFPSCSEFWLRTFPRSNPSPCGEL